MPPTAKTPVAESRAGHESLTKAKMAGPTMKGTKSSPQQARAPSPATVRKPPDTMFSISFPMPINRSARELNDMGLDKYVLSFMRPVFVPVPQDIHISGDLCIK